jgi:hypothetical protein
VPRRFALLVALVVSLLAPAAAQATSVTSPTASPSTTAASVQHVRYTVGFIATTSLGANGTITLTADNGTVMPTLAQIHDNTASTSFTRTATRTPGNNAEITINLCCSDAINSSDSITITLDDVTNPAAGSHSLSIKTSGDVDPASTSPSFTVDPQQPVTNVTAPSLSSTAAGVQHVRYSFSFNAGANNGGLVAPGTITIAAPAGTVLPTVAQIHDDTSGASFSRSAVRSSGNATITTALCCTDAIGAGDHITITLDDVTNAAAGAHTFSVSTSSSPTPVTSSSYSLDPTNPVTNVTAPSLSSAAGGVQHVRYSFSFMASAGNGGLVAPGTITIAAPAGTVLPTVAQIRDETAGTSFSRSAARSNSNATITTSLCCTDAINPGDKVTITLDDVTNAATGGPYSFNVSTSSNPTPVSSPAYSLSAPQQVTDVTPVTTSTDSRGILSDSFSFKTSVLTGRLVPPGTITIAGPPGTVMPTVVQIRDVTSGASFSRSTVRTNSNATVTTALCCSDVINPGDTVTVGLAGVTNPPGVVGPFIVSTSSDTAAVTTPPPPVIGKQATAAVEKGLVRVKLPGKKGFVTLTQTTSIPLGSTLDTTKGQVALTFATNAAGTSTQRGSFSQGQFQVQQSKKNPLTTVSMVGSGLNTCKAPLPKGGAAKPSAVAAAKHRRTLFSHVKGRFRTRGRNSTATVRGTVWRVTDTCSGTKTTVTQGTVVVRDLTLRRNIVLKAGHSYLARAPLRKKKKH